MMDRRGFFRLIGGAFVAAVGVMVGRKSTPDFGETSLASMHDILLDDMFLRDVVAWRHSVRPDGTLFIRTIGRAEFYEPTSPLELPPRARKFLYGSRSE